MLRVRLTRERTIREKNVVLLRGRDAASGSGLGSISGGLDACCKFRCPCELVQHNDLPEARFGQVGAPVVDGLQGAWESSL